MKVSWYIQATIKIVRMLHHHDFESYGAKTVILCENHQTLQKTPHGKLHTALNKYNILIRYYWGTHEESLSL